MNWVQARNLLNLAVHRQREAATNREESRNGASVASKSEGAAPAEPKRGSVNGNGTNGSTATGPSANGIAIAPQNGAAPKRAASLCVVSGKGGTGKSVVTSAVSTMLAKLGPTLIFDADLGVGNAHILQGVSPENSFVDVADGRLSVQQIVHSCRPGLDLLSAGSGVSRMSALSAYEIHLIASGIEQLELEYDYLMIDSAAGISAQTALFASTCDRVLLVTTPDLTAMTDAYAFLKVLYTRNKHADVRLVVNRADSEEEGSRTARRICSVSDRFLGRKPEWIATLPEDSAVRRAGNRRTSVVLSEPEAPVAVALTKLAEALTQELDQLRGDAQQGMGLRLVASSGFSNRRMKL